jgi:hypothetical protein
MELLKECVSVLESLGGEDVKRTKREITSPYESFTQMSSYSHRHALSSLLSSIVEVHLHRDSTVVARWLTNLGLLMVSPSGPPVDVFKKFQCNCVT